MSLKVNSCICETDCFTSLKDYGSKGATCFPCCSHCQPVSPYISFHRTFSFPKPWDLLDYWLHPKIRLLCTAFRNSEENPTSCRLWAVGFFTPRDGNMAHTGWGAGGSSPARSSLETGPNLWSFQENIRPEISQEWAGSGEFWQFLLLTPPKAEKQPQK